MIPVISIEYSGYIGNYKSDPKFPTEEKESNTLKEYVEGFVKSAESIVKAHPGATILFEPINEPWGYTTPQYNGAEYASVIAKLLPAANTAHLPLNNIYVGAIGKDCVYKGATEECSTNGWVPAMYKAQSKLETEIQGWYFHPYGPPSGVEYYDSEGIQSVPLVQSTMTSGQNNIIVSEVGYCAEDVNEGEGCGGDGLTSIAAAADLTTMLSNALPYHQAGWLRALLVYSRNDGGWAMQIPPKTLTKQGEALDEFADSFGLGWWSIQSTPNPTEYSLLEGVSCASVTFCIAVGNTANTSGVTLAQKWNGSSWTTQSTPNPAGEVNFIELKGISCPSTTACTAVGGYLAHGGMSLAERWEGEKWTIQSTPNLEPSSYRLASVSCPSTSVCFAAGYEYPFGGSEKPLIERWSGGTWSKQLAPGSGTESELSGVSCSSTTSCYAVGYSYSYSEESDSPLIESWNGEKWSVDSTPSIFGWLNTISCVSSTSCTAVGNDESGTILAEHLEGASWSATEPPMPKGGATGHVGLYGVSCISTTRCTAVGGYGNSSIIKLPFAESWNGSKWSVQSMPNPGGVSSSQSDVSCTALTACTAVGNSVPSTFKSATLAERYSE